MFNDFALLLGGGMLLVISLGRVREISAGYFRLVGMLVLALVSLAVAWLLLSPNGSSPPLLRIIASTTTAAAAISLMLTPSWSQTRPALLRCLAFLGGIAGWMAACSPIVDPSLPDSIPPPLFVSPLLALNVLGQAVLLGSVTCAWLLGHAYLTAAHMTIAPLQRFGTILLFAFLGRAVGVAATLVTLFLTHWRTSPALIRSALPVDNVSLVMRVLVGIGVAGVFTFMTRDCIRRRNTQSATGILYFNSALIYLGELSASYMTRMTGWPW